MAFFSGGIQMTTDSPGDGIERRSLDDESVREALEYKWYLSQERGYDVGPAALDAWIDDHWSGFLRARWIEHMLGVRFWTELGREEFGMLKQEFGEFRTILDEIVEMLKSGGENLNILCWSNRCKNTADQLKVRKILHKLRINDHRLRCKVSQRMGTSSSNCVPC